MPIGLFLSNIEGGGCFPPRMVLPLELRWGSVIHVSNPTFHDLLIRPRINEISAGINKISAMIDDVSARINDVSARINDVSARINDLSS